MANNPRAVANLKFGNPGNRGGGRPADKFREQVRKGMEKYKLIAWYMDLARGEKVDRKVIYDKAGEAHVHEVPAPVDTRKDAIEKLKEWGYGKDVQPVEVDIGRFVVICDQKTQETEGL